jgi:hypothetical protein
MNRPALLAAINRELDRPALAVVSAVAAQILADHGSAVRAILFYGSCRRTGDTSGLIDLAVIHDDQFAYHRRVVPAVFNAMLPPHVVQVQAGPSARAKVAIYGSRQFRRRLQPSSLDTTVWARFCQPASLLYARDAAARDWVADSLADGIETAALWAGRFGGWAMLFRRTYDAELRPEPPGRAAMIYEENRVWFDAIPVAAAARGVWVARIVVGKTLNVLRLIKAAFTFVGGADYIAWKIERHTGVRLELSDWQRRHPVLAAPVVLVRLRRKQGLLS